MRTERQPPKIEPPVAQTAVGLLEHRPGVWTLRDDHRRNLRRLRPINAYRLGRETGFLLGLTFAAWLLAGRFGAGLPVALLVLLFGACGLFSRHRDAEVAEANEEVLALRDEFGAGPAWTVDLIIRQGEAPTGRDQGLMWVEGGRILFSGKRTSFAISPAQADGPVRHEPAVRGLRLRLNLDLAAQTEVGPVSLSFWPIAEGVQRREEDASSMRYAFNTVIEGTRWQPAKAVEGQWPPFDIGPEALEPTQARREVFGRIGLWTVGAILFSVPLTATYPLLGLIEFGGICFFAYLLGRKEIRQRYQAYCDAQKAWRTS